MKTGVGIKYISLYEKSGYGIAARRYIQGLVALGVPVTWTPMIPGKGWKLGYEPFDGKAIGDAELDPYCNADIPYDTVIIHTVPEYFPNWIALEAGKRIIGYTVWETDIIPQHWGQLLNTVDSLMVPCQWNREVMESCDVSTPISVVPHVGPGKEINTAEFSHPAIRADDFVFYSINTWTPRKAVWNTVEAYLDTFTSNDPVVLVLKTSAKDFTQPLTGLLDRLSGRSHRKSSMRCEQIQGRYPNAARILVLDSEMSDREVMSLHLRGDCYVSLCRSEGWGMGAFDASFYGNPVIMTGFGGQLEFLSESTAYLVKFELERVEYHKNWSSYSGDQTWAKPDIEDASRKLRHVFENRKEAGLRGVQSQQFVKEQFSTEKICQKMIQRAWGDGVHNG